MIPSTALRQTSANASGSMGMVPLVDLHHHPSSAANTPVSPPPPSTATPAAQVATQPAALPPASAPPSNLTSRPSLTIRINTTAMHAIDKLAGPLATNAAFRTAVQTGDAAKAAVAAVKYFMDHYQHMIHNKPDQPLPQAAAVAAATAGIGTSLTAETSSPLKRTDSDPYSRTRRGLDAIAARKPEERHKEFNVGDRVVVASGNKRMSAATEFIGSTAEVTKVEPNGWVLVTFQDGRELRIQQRYLAHTNDAEGEVPGPSRQASTAAGVHPMEALEAPPPTGASLAAALAAFPPVPEDLHGIIGTDSELLLDGPTAHPPHPPHPPPRPPLPPAPQPAEPRQPPLDAQPSKYHQQRTPMLVGRAVTKMREMVKVIRREVLALEESVPWGAVDAVWRGQRSAWRRALRAAETVPEVSQAMMELHLALLTDKMRGLFQAGGHWERGIQECAAGKSGYQALQQLWGDMQEEVNGWMAQGGDARAAKPAHLQEPVSAEAAARAAAALEAAGQKGAPYITQVPLSGILNSSKENFLALRSLVERERHKVLSQIDAIGTGRAAGGDASAEGLVGQQGGVLGAGRSGSGSLFGAVPLQESMEAEMKVQLGAADMDTDADDGSEATDMEESD